MEIDLVIKVKYGDSMMRFNAFVKYGDTRRCFNAFVKYGDTMRRCQAYLNKKTMKLNMAALTDKIRALFKLSPDADLILTYIDADKDLVTLVEDDDLDDAIFFQKINPLKINVTLNSKDQSSPSQSHPRSQGGAALRSSGVQPQPTCTCCGFEQVTIRMPEPLRDALLKLSSDLVTKATTSSPITSELVTCITNLGLSSLGRPSRGQAGCTSFGAYGSMLD